MSIPLTDVVYPLDQTGQSVSNRILNERHELTNTTWSGFNLVIPKATPFFDDSIDHLVHYPSGDILVKGRDWIPGWMFQSATGEIGQFLSGCIYISDTSLKGQIEIPSYQCLGGEWQIDTQVLTAILAEKLLNPQRYYWEYVAKTPNIFRPLDHDEDIDSFSELGDLLDSLRGIERAIIESSESGSLDLHIAERNPHRTGPADLTYPLDKLRNWDPVTMLELVDPNNLPTDRYVTPPAVKRLIDTTALAALAAYAARRDNPNVVTAAQAGTLTTDEIHALIQDYLTGGTGALNAATLQGRDLAGVVSEVVLAVDPVLKASYDALYAEVSAILENVVANDTALFAGMSRQAWEQNINTLIESQTLVTQFEPVQELLYPEWSDPGDIIPDISETEPSVTLIASIVEDTVAARSNSSLLHMTINKVTYEFTIHAMTRQITCWSSAPLPTGYRFFLDDSGTSDEMRLWMEAPANRVGGVVVNTNIVSVIVSDGYTIYTASSAVQPVYNNPVTIPVKVKASVAELEAIGSVVTTQGQALTNQGQALTTYGQNIVTLNNNVATLTARPTADLILVNGNSNIAAGAAAEFDLTALITAAGKQGQFDLGKAVVEVRLKNTDADSPNFNSWINAEAACSYGLRANLTTAFVYNHTAGAVLAYVRVSVPKS